ncbi:MAG TPA: FAD:protein FMN transferase [Firmicutes bacterium]|nr:FAD:protein FMN transferase [Bacillota bacterium]
MDTVVEINACAPEGMGRDELRKAVEDAFEAMARVDRLMNARAEGSDIWRVNRAAGSGSWISVDEWTFRVIKRALFFARLSSGAFDPTILPLMELWGFGTKPHVPRQEEIGKAKRLVDWTAVDLDESNFSVRLNRPGMGLDLGAIAKGFAVDRAFEALKRSGVTRAIVNAGGNVYALGKRPDGGKWKVGVRDPDEPGTYVTVMRLEEQTAVTSGDYERYFEDGGKRYHHIIDPASGYPADSDIRSVTVILPRTREAQSDIGLVPNASMDADALSTMLFILGKEKALKFADENGIGLIIVDARRGISASKWAPEIFPSEHVSTGDGKQR